MSKIRWGVISTAKIGTEKVLPAMQKAEYCEVAAIASRNIESAQATAKQMGIAKAYGSYEELLADPDIDAIYNPLPNHLHVSWSIKALEAGKHVLCEKPIGLSAEEGQQLVDAGKRHPKLKLMEAFMYRHHPQWQRARQIVREGGIGRLCSIQTAFSYFNNDADNIRNRVDIGGGGLMDIGCYPISLSRFIFEAEPTRTFGITECDPNFQTDRLTSAILDFGLGTSTFTCSTQMVPYQRVNIFGVTGRIEIEIPFNAPPDRPCKLWHQRGTAIEEITFETCNQYGIQGDLFSQAILNDTPVPTPIEDAVSNMRVIEAIFRSAESGGWATV
ncbi:MAG: Gfo/Idh/MocA family oxidoreductase [Planctomycetaceae bacterium]|nr:Gfo/Idh/MocA family oxidoreductase [Planctomycetales bacterium]MCB9874513.1 Gfo/Idh/MocA family oxidoreductase [Planctomycetaceae bacterium]MCB9940856.1 Gfo/Idh/MocA family oxidoreductase [Planctomycetaceae bacterium]